MKISTIYNQYKIPQNLQEHMLRVTAVALLICNNFKKEINKDEVVISALLHDMGNIIKFDLTLFPDALGPQGSEYWEKVKQEFIDKYGNDEHEATHQIINEIGVSKNVEEIITSLGFARAVELYESTDFARKICVYADQRTSPFGVLSLKERVENGRMRFLKNKKLKDIKKYLDENKFYSSYLEKIEKQIFENCKIKPEDITDKSIKPLMEELRNFSLQISS